VSLTGFKPLGSDLCVIEGTDSLVESLDEFKSMTLGYNMASPVMFEEWTLDSTNCSTSFLAILVFLQVKV